MYGPATMADTTPVTSPYSPLRGPHCIRLLSIDEGDEGDPLSCTLEELDLANPPPRYCSFSALSYRWGDEYPVFDISLNGCSVPIRENLYHFLRYARSVGWFKNLWIDAVCINQDNMVERVQQVGIMGMVYSLASNVLIWLGKRSREELRALEEISDAEYAIRYQNNLLYRKSYVDLVSPKALNGLKTLISDPYWSRKWIIQEILLGGPNVSIVTSGSQYRLADLGGECLSALIDYVERNRHQDQNYEMWNARRELAKSLRGGLDSDSTCDFDKAMMGSFSDWASYHRQHNWERWQEETYHTEVCCRRPSALESILQRFHTPQMTYKPAGLMGLVCQYAESECSEPWDNVYALAGLADSSSTPIIVDYDLDRADIYWRFLLGEDDTRLYGLRPGLGPTQVISLYHGPRRLQKALRLSNNDVARGLNRVSNSPGVVSKWQFQFIEALRHVFSELRVSVSSSSPAASALPRFELDYAGARKLPPTQPARALMADLFCHVWERHLSIVSGTEPVLFDVGLYDYTILRVVQGVLRDPFWHVPLQSTECGKQTLDIYDHASAPVLTTVVRHGGDDKHRRLHHIIVQRRTMDGGIGTQPATRRLLRLQPGDLILMFNGHQVALAARRVSVQEVLCGAVGTCGLTSSDKFAFLKPHCTIRLDNWGANAEESEWRMQFRG